MTKSNEDLLICHCCGMLLHLDGTDKVRIDLALALGLDYRTAVEVIGHTPVYRYWCEDCGRDETEILKPIPRPIQPGDLGSLPWKLER